MRFWVWSFPGAQDGHDRCLTCLGIQHAEEAFVGGSCSSSKEKKRKGDMTISELRIDSAVSNMAESLCLCRDSPFVLAPGVALHPVESEVIEGHGEGFPKGVPHPSSAPQPVRLPLERAGTSAEWGTPPISFGASLTTRCRSLHRRASSSLSGDDDPAALPPSGVVALSEPDPEMTAMLSRAAENVGLV